MSGGQIYQVAITDPTDPHTKGMVYQVTIVGGGNVVETTRAMPIPSADNFNRTFLFTGITNSDYTHGVIYENKKTATYSATVSFSPNTISCSGSDFIALVATYIGNVSAIVRGTMIYDDMGNLWRFTGLDSEGRIVGSFQLYSDDYEDADWTMPANPEDGDIVEFTCAISETSASYAWSALNS